MSMHKSLKLKNTLMRQRSVLSRWERIEQLLEEEKWQEGDSVLGLPKVRTKFKVKSRKAQKKTDEAQEGEEGAAEGEGEGETPPAE